MIGRLKLNSNYLLEKFIFILLSFSMDEVVLLNMKYLNANSFVRLHLMGLLHGFTSKRFSKRWNHPSDNHIGFRYKRNVQCSFRRFNWEAPIHILYFPCYILH